MKCPKCGAEIKTPIKTWTQKKGKVLMGRFECYRCKTKFTQAISSKRSYEEFIENNDVIKEWLEKKPKNTKIKYASLVQKFCEFSNIKPEEFLELPAKKARDVAWEFIKTLWDAKNDKTSTAINAMYALKSFYRNHDGEKLPFDSIKGGKHHINGLRRKRVKYEHVPKRKEVYRIANMATNLRDRAIVLTLFQSGIRVNALISLNYSHVKDQLAAGKVPLRIKINDDIDTKLKGYSVAFYYAFLGKESVEALKEYCEKVHRFSKDDTPLFMTDSNKRMRDVLIWTNLKGCIERAGFDKRTITTHTIRKAFRRCVRQADINEELKEVLMGHKLKGTMENYYDRNDLEEIQKQYEKIDFSEERNGVRISEFAELKLERETLRSVIMNQRSEIDDLKQKVEKTENVGGYIDHLYKQMEMMQKQINEFTGKKTKLDMPTFVQKE